MLWWKYLVAAMFYGEKRASILQISQKNDFFFKRCRTTTNIYQIDSDLVWSLILWSLICTKWIILAEQLLLWNNALLRSETAIFFAFKKRIFIDVYFLENFPYTNLSKWYTKIIARHSPFKWGFIHIIWLATGSLIGNSFPLPLFLKNPQKCWKIEVIFYKILLSNIPHTNYSWLLVRSFSSEKEVKLSV